MIFVFKQQKQWELQTVLESTTLFSVSMEVPGYNQYDSLSITENAPNEKCNAK